ncbi:hypothetical protein PQA66_gp04 [Yersinia phage vB_YenM_201.16]|uniref:Uncharacterized protein n=1 Tax=Yersinia phage vB_YenM_201.16 TaxID=2918921 RepID=A0AAE9JYL8_9CAUD|nr:hypothetical protein PQA66_gp04 [Yersinia phage vB_YenM_201.16]UNA05947.1 hypothetical protein vBYenM20116_004 [Yersinia phage vB_YenM_201.16]
MIPYLPKFASDEPLFANTSHHLRRFSQNISPYWDIVNRFYQNEN